MNAMKKRKLNHRKSRESEQAKADCQRLHQNGMESDYNGSFNVIVNGHMIPGLQMASKAFEIIQNMELGKPHELPINWVETPQGATMAQGVAETVKSKCQFIMDWIEVQTLPQPERVQTCQRCFIV
jgi:hypothetical protein